MISVMNAGCGRTERDVCFENNRCVTFDKVAKWLHGVSRTKLREVEADTAGEGRAETGKE